MVEKQEAKNAARVNFQYSLCRVVLMVAKAFVITLSSKRTFSTRSVESF